jgi:ADP-heptose:LPS heptosyltransferase
VLLVADFAKLPNSLYMDPAKVSSFKAIRRVGAALHAGRQWTVSPSGVKAWSRLMPGLQRRLGRPPLSDLTQVRRLGVLRPDGMGDMVLTTGMLRELRRQLPKTRITLICQASWAAWMRTCPWVDEVVDVGMTSSVGFGEPKRLLELLRFAKRVWPLELEVLVQPGTLYWYVPSRALAWFSGAPVRLCWEDPDSGVDTGGGFHTHNLPYPNGWHETDKCFRMLEAMGLKGEGRRLDTWWTPEDARRGAEIAREARRGRRKLVALGLAASEPPKRWRRQRYLEVIREVGTRRDAAFLALGGPDVDETCRWLSERVPGLVTYAGDRLPLGVIWAAIAQCDLYLGNDSGFMHMAAAARIPVVVVIGVADGARPGTRGDPSHTGPCDTLSRVVRPPAGTASDMEPDTALVAADAVATATLELLS